MNREEYYTVQEAAKVLDRTERRVRQLAESGEVAGIKEGNSWHLFRYSVHSFRDSHPTPGRARITTVWPQEAREALEEIKDLRYQLGRMEGRLELEAVARSTLEAQLQREQERADEERKERLEAQRERLEVQEEFRTLQEEIQSLRGDLDAERSKGFWQRLFGR